MTYTCSVSVTGKEYFYKQYKNGHKVRVASEKIKGEKPICVLSEKALLAKSLNDIDRLTKEKNALESQLTNELSKQKMIASQTISDNQQKIQKLQSDKAALESNLKSLKKSSQDERQDLLQQISRLDSVISTLNIRNNQLSEEIIANQNLIQSITGEKNSLQTKNSQMSQDLIEAKNIISRHLVEKEKLQAELYMKEEALSQLVLQNNTSSEKIMYLESELATLREEMRVLQLRHKVELENFASEKSDLSTKAIALQGQINILETNIEFIKNESTKNLANRDESIFKLQTEVEELLSKISEYQRAEAALASEIQQIKQNNSLYKADIEAKEQILSNIRNELENLSLTYSQAQSDLENMKLEISGLKVSVDELQRELQEKNIELESILKQKNNLESSLTRNLSIKDNENKKLREEISQYEKDIEKLKSSLNEYITAKAVRGANDELNKRDKKISLQAKQLRERGDFEKQLREEIQEKEKSLLALKDELSKSQSLNNLLKKDLAAMRVKIEEIEKECSSIRDQRGQKIQSLVKDLKSNSVNYQSQIKNLIAQKNQLESSLEIKNKSIESMLKNANELKEQVDEGKKSADKLKFYISELESKIQYLSEVENDNKAQREEIKRLQEEKEVVRSELEKVNSANRKTIFDLETELFEVKEKSSQYMKEIEAQSRLYGELQSTISVLESQSSQRFKERGIKIGSLVEEHRKTRAEYMRQLKDIKAEQFAKEKQLRDLCQEQIEQITSSKDLKITEINELLVSTQDLVENQKRSLSEKDAIVGSLENKYNLFSSKTQADIEQLKDEIILLKNLHTIELEKLTNQITSTNQAHDEIVAQLKDENLREISNYKSTIEQLDSQHQSELEKLLNEIKGLRQEVSVHQKKLNEYEQLQKTYDDLLEEKNLLERQLKASSSTLGSKEKAAYNQIEKSLIKKVNELKEKLNSTTEKLIQTENKLSEYEMNYKGIKNDFEREKLLNTNLQSNLDESNNKIKLITEQLVTAQFQLQTAINDTSKHFSTLCLGSEEGAKNCLDEIYQNFDSLKPKNNDLLCFESAASGANCIKKVLDVFPEALALNIKNGSIVSIILNKDGQSYEVEFNAPIKVDIDVSEGGEFLLPLLPLENKVRQILQSNPKELKINRLQLELENVLSELEPLRLKVKSTNLESLIITENEAKSALSIIKRKFPELLQPTVEEVENVIDITTQNLFNLTNPDDYKKMKASCELFYQKNFGKRGQNYLSHRQKELGMKTEDVCYTAVEYVKNKTAIKDLIDQLLESKGKKFTSSKDYNNHYQICSDIASKLLGPKQKENFINFVASNANKDSAAFYQNNLIQNRRDKYYKPLAEDVGKQKTREWCDSFSQGIKDNLN